MKGVGVNICEGVLIIKEFITQYCALNLCELEKLESIAN